MEKIEIGKSVGFITIDEKGHYRSILSSIKDEKMLEIVGEYPNSKYVIHTVVADTMDEVEREVNKWLIDQEKKIDAHSISRKAKLANTTPSGPPGTNSWMRYQDGNIVELVPDNK